MVRIPKKIDWYRKGRISPPSKILRSVTFYFTDESEPSLVSSLGHFLFYRRVRTVTRLICEGKINSFTDSIVDFLSKYY